MDTKTVRDVTRFVFMRLPAVLGLVAVVFVFRLADIGFVPAIVLSDAYGLPRAILPLPDGVFTHVFTHSVHLSRVDESFRVGNDTRLRLFETRFDNYGVGIPTDEGEGFREEGGRFVLDISRTFDRLPVRVSHLPGDGVVVGGSQRDFTEWFASGDLVVISAILLPNAIAASDHP
ncbi:MAG: DUF1850 domain-containing protein [Spirochaetes bacterium]|nr:DUF1850 domain-containing protein [Spirochaetota bacterium]